MWAHLQIFRHWWISLPWTTWLDQTDKTVRILAVIIGGGWAYMKFVKGRIFSTRLEPTVTGHCFHDKRGDYVIATIKLKNVGASNIVLQKAGTVLTVAGCPRATSGALERPVQWREINVKSIFEDHTSVEPSETIENSVLVDLPPHMIAVRLEARVVASGIECSAVTITETGADEGPLC
jgi:hypothetical protein